MNNLKNSIVFLFFYLLMILGVAQVNYIEENVLNFSPAFFVLMAAAVLAGLFIPSAFRASIYLYLMFWSLVYGATWWVYWRYQMDIVNPQVLIIQFILLEIAAGLAFDVGVQLFHLNELFERLATSTYPNRTLRVEHAQDRIGAELTRSRRYHHPLSLLVVEIGKTSKKEVGKQFEGLRADLLRRFAVAKIGQIINDNARETDLILNDKNGRFLVMCPETDFSRSIQFADRLQRAVAEAVGVELVCGTAAFPDEALTFEKLLERAESRISIAEAVTPVMEKTMSDPK